MGNRPFFERYLWFDKKIRNRLFPNARHLRDEFGISLRTARRAIDDMRTFFGAPLAYSHSRKGFYYSDTSFSLPPLWISQEELLAVLIARNLLSSCSGGVISAAIDSVGKRLEAITEKHTGFRFDRLDSIFSASWNEHAPTEPAVFQQVVRALLDTRLLTFSYTSPRTGIPSERMVEPHHLRHYRGTWFLLAWCRNRGQWRTFALPRMTEIILSAASFMPRPEREWQPLVNTAFGIFQGDNAILVRIRFTPERAAWIREQSWHPEQRLEETDDGSLVLSLMVADLREIKMRVLQFGADAQVLEPNALRLEIIDEISRMKKIYVP